MIITWLAITFHAARRARQPLLHEAELARAEELARLLEVGAGRPDLIVAAGLVGPVLALVEQDQVHGAPEAQRGVDAVAAPPTGYVGMLSK